MKKIFFITMLGLFSISCQNNVTSVVEKTSAQVGIIEENDAKSLAINAFNDAYLANDMSDQVGIFTEDAIANVNSQEMTAKDMIAAFMEGKKYYDNITNSERTTLTLILDNGSVYTNTWFAWTGTSKSTGVTLSNEVHAYFKWKGDKITSVGYIFDSAEYVANMGSTE
jgi:hypothetical protein